MKIEKIKLRNFRQFYGDQELALATDSKKNVTLIHAENGIGKTTILNAVLWAFYSEVTAKFEQREKIVNFEALKEHKDTATVSVQFEFNGQVYVAQRHYHHSTGKEDFSAFRIENGVSKNINAPETFINSVIPREMAPYFFFDGEAAEAFSSETNHRKVSTAIRSILGCDLAETAIADLKELAKGVDSQLGSIPGQDELKELEHHLSEVDEQIRKETETKDRLEKDIETFKDQYELIVKKLRETEGTRQLQSRRDDKERTLRQTEADLKAEQEEIIRWIGQKAIQVVSRKLSKETLSFIDEASLKGRIPSPYNQEFVTGLLNAEICVCHRPLLPGTPEFKAVADLLKSASNAITMGRVVQARARIQQFKEGAVDALRLLEMSHKRRSELLNRRTMLEQEIAELGKKIGELPVEEIAEREKARKKLDDTIKQRTLDLGVARHRLNQANIQRAEINRNIERVSAQSDKALRLVRRRSLIAATADLLKSSLSSYEQDARGVIQAQTNKILEKAARRDYRCRFNESFGLELLYSDGNPTPKSGGENQLLSLSFVASLVKFSEIRSKASGSILRPGTIAPLLLDSPFGQLDVTYKAETARFIPQMASQVLLLVSSSQGSEDVLTALEPYIGAEYILISENRTSRGDKPEDRKSLRNKMYVGSLFGRPKDLTRIERVA